MASPDTKPELLFGSFNHKKLEEIRQAVGEHFVVRGCAEFPGLTEAPETTGTLEGNAEQKARFYHEKTGLPCFSDDTGLEVEALNGAPGVDSAFYGGEQGNAARNIERLLREMAGVSNRKARFRTVIAFVDGSDALHTFEGVLEGEILSVPKGENGFGYDPVFLPEGETRALAEFSLAEKNQCSHRGRAMAKFIAFLNATAGETQAVNAT